MSAAPHHDPGAGAAHAPSPWMITREAAAYVRCSPRTLEGLRRTGGGPAYHRQGARLVLYHRDDLDAWRGQGRARNTTEERLSGVPLAGLPPPDMG